MIEKKAKPEAGEVFRGYCVKYALTAGIFEADFEISSSGCAYEVGKPIFNGMVIGKDVFRSKEEALTAAAAMAQRKIASLDKQRKKLEKLVAEPKWSSK